jgi:flagellar protein FlaI
MPAIVFPFQAESIADKESISPETSSVFPQLAPEFQEVVKENRHLLTYLHMLPISSTGVPVYFAKPARKLGENKKPNYIYPSNNKGVFIHVLFNDKDQRNSYIPIEPSTVKDYSGLMHQVETKLLDIRGEINDVKQDPDPKQQFLNYVNRVVVSDGIRNTPEKGGFSKRIQRLINRVEPLKVTAEELSGINYLYLRDKYGLGMMDPLITDPYIEDISCSGLGNVFIEHKIFKSLKSALVFSDADDLDQFVLWLSERIKKPITFRNPISDATLPDGSRINIVFGNAVSRRGSNFSIRKFAGTPTSIFELVDFGSLSYQMLAYLSLAIGNGMNLFVSGETASGKTTLLNALTTFMHPLAKIVTIEDTPELQVPHKNWIREVVQTTQTDGSSSAVNMFDLLRAALRQRPNNILIGEIRGAEGNVAFQAMQT